jgi:hypothetical protein
MENGLTVRNSPPNKRGIGEISGHQFDLPEYFPWQKFE